MFTLGIGIILRYKKPGHAHLSTFDLIFIFKKEWEKLSRVKHLLIIIIRIQDRRIKTPKIEIVHQICEIDLKMLNR